MRKTFIFALATTALSCGLTMPAMAADWVRIGAVDVSHGMDRDTTYSRFGGGVDRLRLDVSDSNVQCRSVRATFANGPSREIFQGRLQAGRSAVIELPGDRAQVRKLDFKCRAQSRRGATIVISAEVNSYRDQWRRSPDWDRTWSRLFHWGPVTAANGPNRRPGHHGGWNDRWNDRDWVSISTQSFEGRRDRETAVAGWQGRSVDRIALRPVDGDARCSRVSVRFNNGRTRDLDVNRGQHMERGRGYTFDLPGGDRNVREVMLQCSPLDARSVRIEVMARK